MPPAPVCPEGMGNIPYMAGLPIGVYDTIANGNSQNSVFSLLYWGVRVGIFPPLIFLGIGTLTDFSALISSPKSLLLGAAAQIGIFATFARLLPALRDRLFTPFAWGFRKRAL